MGEPLLWHDLAFRPHGFPRHSDPSALYHHGASGQQARSWACEGLVAEGVHCRRNLGWGRTRWPVEGVVAMPLAWLAAAKWSRLRARLRAEQCLGTRQQNWQQRAIAISCYCNKRSVSGIPHAMYSTSHQFRFGFFFFLPRGPSAEARPRPSAGPHKGFNYCSKHLTTIPFNACTNT